MNVICPGHNYELQHWYVRILVLPVVLLAKGDVWSHRDLEAVIRVTVLDVSFLVTAKINEVPFNVVYCLGQKPVEGAGAKNLIEFFEPWPMN